MNDLNTYITVGAGGISVITIIFLFRFIIVTSIKKITPSINQLNMTTAVTEEVLKNNTKALEGNSQSTVAVAEAIKVLSNSVCNQNDILQKVYNKSSVIENHVASLDGYMRGKKEAEENASCRAID